MFVCVRKGNPELIIGLCEHVMSLQWRSLTNMRIILHLSRLKVHNVLNEIKQDTTTYNGISNTQKSKPNQIKPP